MARAAEPKHKVSRRFGVDLYGTGGASLARRLAVPPGGVRPGRRRRRSEYALQLEEKQKARAYYGVTEAQFRRFLAQARRQPGPPGENLLRLLERRLDNVVYALGFARSRPMARQLVNHGHVLVDGRRVDIPSFLVDVGQRITLTPAAAAIPGVIESLAEGRPVPGWLEREDGADAGGPPAGRVRALPERADVALPIDEAAILAFYAR
ncbi:MAG TPA: 30S ribosomal protein S4 [Chloroflexota bacterium]|nr:30S ribosomal protein S4 [Chloroflexota bacterium]